MIDEKAKAEAQLQELYNHLEHVINGNMYMAWYAQARAKEMSHREALIDTLNYFHIPTKPWYVTRIKTGMLTPIEGVYP